MGEFYHIRSRGKVMAPLDEMSLRRLILRGAISRFDEVSSDRATWVPLDQSAIWRRVNDLGRLRLETAAPDRNARDNTGLDHQNSSEAISHEEFSKSSSGTSARPARRLVYMLTVLPILIVGGVLVNWRILATQEGDLRGWGQTPTSPAFLSEKASDTPIAPFQSSVFPLPQSAATTASVIDNVQDESAIANAVGFVVVGFQAWRGDSVILQRPLITGSCFTISPNGFAITNKHVVADVLKQLDDPELHRSIRQESQIEFRPHIWVFFGTQKCDADIAYQSDRFDLAVLKVNRPVSRYFRLADPDSLTRGVDALAAGFPGVGSQPLTANEFNDDLHNLQDVSSPDIQTQFKTRDFNFTLTKGYISRTFSDDHNDQWIQHEAVIRHGNSGGPLMASDGVVVGINTRIQQDDAGDVQTNLSLEISQLRQELDSHVQGLVWIAEPKKVDNGK